MNFPPMAVLDPSVSPDSPRARAHRWLSQALIQKLIIALIIANGLILGLETSRTISPDTLAMLKMIDRIILAAFTLEVLLRLWIYRRNFWKDAWSIFDFLVVAISLIPTSGPMSVLRVLRLLRLVSMVPRLRLIAESLLRAIPGIFAIAGLLALLFYVFAIIAVNLFGQTHNEWFGTVGRAMYTLFQVMTLESWSMGISRPVMEEHPWAWAFFVPFILVATFTMLNLFIAIIVNAMQSIHDHDAQVIEPDPASVTAANAPKALDTQSTCTNPQPLAPARSVEPATPTDSASLESLAREQAQLRAQLARIEALLHESLAQQQAQSNSPSQAGPSGQPAPSGHQ